MKRYTRFCRIRRQITVKANEEKMDIFRRLCYFALSKGIKELLLSPTIILSNVKSSLYLVLVTIKVVENGHV